MAKLGSVIQCLTCGDDIIKAYPNTKRCSVCVDRDRNEGYRKHHAANKTKRNAARKVSHQLRRDTENARCRKYNTEHRAEINATDRKRYAAKKAA